MAAVARTLQKHLAENDSAEEAAHWTALSEAFKSGGCTRLHGDLRSLQQAVQNYEKQGGQSFWAELLPFACSQALRFDELFPEPIAIVEETVAGKVCTRACVRARRLPPFPHTSPYKLKPSRRAGWRVAHCGVEPGAVPVHPGGQALSPLPRASLCVHTTEQSACLCV